LAKPYWSFPFTDTRQFEATLIDEYFVKITDDEALPADLILYSGHGGIYDPDGCPIVHTAQCEKNQSNIRGMSARSGKNLEVQHGRSSWFHNGQYLAWKGFTKSTS